MVLVKTGDQYSGYTYDEGMGYCKANFKGVFNTDSKKLKGRGDGMIEKTFWHTQCVYNLTYYKDGDKEYLSGLAWPKSLATKILSFGIPISMTVTRVRSTIDITEYMVNKMNSVQPIIAEETIDTVMAVLNEFNKQEEKIISIRDERIADTIQTLTVSSKKLKISIFDNGISDGDSVSVVYNDRLITPGLTVTGKPYELELELDWGKTLHSFTLVAHNLGSIPPNTATVTIEDGTDKYRLTANSDLKRNAVILIKMK